MGTLRRSWVGLFSGVVLMAFAAHVWAADEEPKVYRLWSGAAPGAKGEEDADIPNITVYLPKPELANGAAVVVCPGGGYGMLAINHEGKQVAEWLNSIGVAGVVLKYRLGPRYHHPAMLNDVSRAIRTVRARAEEWKLDPKRVGVMGFSAGGHLASTAGTHFDAGKADAEDPIDRLSSRPDVVILVYPVIGLARSYGHKGSLRNLLGENPSRELVESLSNEAQVTKDTPPTFLAHTNADTGVPPENSIYFVLALREAKVPVEFHLFEKGPHGLGLGTGEKRFNVPPDAAFSAWPGLCATWLKGRGFLDKAKP